MLDLVLQELCDVIEAEMGYVVLHDSQGKQLEMRTVSSDDLIQKTLYLEKMKTAAENAIKKGGLICEEYESPHCKIMTVPLILREQLSAYLERSTGIRRRFTDDQQRLLRL